MGLEKLQLTQLETQVLQILDALGEVDNIEGGNLFDLINETIEKIFPALDKYQKKEISITTLEKVTERQNASYEKEATAGLNAVGAAVQTAADNRAAMARLFGEFRTTGADDRALNPMIIDIPPETDAA